MTCKKCIHNGICIWTQVETKNNKNCKNFKNKADFVEVVRCEKCRAFDEYHYPVEDFDGRCILDGIERDKDFYCRYGKKK